MKFSIMGCKVQGNKTIFLLRPFFKLLPRSQRKMPMGGVTRRRPKRTNPRAGEKKGLQTSPQDTEEGQVAINIASISQGRGERARWQQRHVRPPGARRARRGRHSPNAAACAGEQANCRQDSLAQCVNERQRRHWVSRLGCKEGTAPDGTKVHAGRQRANRARIDTRTCTGQAAGTPAEVTPCRACQRLMVGTRFAETPANMRSVFFSLSFQEGFPAASPPAAAFTQAQRGPWVAQVARSESLRRLWNKGWAHRHQTCIESQSTPERIPETPCSSGPGQQPAGVLTARSQKRCALPPREGRHIARPRGLCRGPHGRRS